MNTYILNIGLHTSLNFTDQVEQLTPKMVLEALEDAYLLVGHYETVESDTEPTLVVHVMDRLFLGSIFENTGISERLDELSDTLMQDCIACYNVQTQTGELVGRHADQWGEFDHNYFIIG